MTATVEPGQPSDWEDTGPIPLYTRPSGDTATWRDRGRVPADLITERDEARAEVEEWRRVAGSNWESANGEEEHAKAMAERAEAAEAEVRDLRARVAHRVCQVWQERSGEVSWRCLCGFVSKHQPLDAARVAYVPRCPDAPEDARALASVGRTEPEGWRRERSKWMKAVMAVEAVADEWERTGLTISHADAAGRIRLAVASFAPFPVSSDEAGRTEPEGSRDWLDVRGDNITFPDPHDYGRTEPAPEAGGAS